MNEKLWEAALNNIKQLDAENFNKRLVKQKKEQKLLRASLVLSLILVLALSIIFFVFNEIFYGIISTAWFVTQLISYIVWRVKISKRTDEYWVTLDEYNKLQNQNNNQTHTKNIKKVYLLDSRTVVKDKLHAIFNFQEIIQIRVYTFKIVYENNTEEVKEIDETDKECLNLLALSKESENQLNKTNAAEEIREYKKLLDEGIITQEEFNKKKELLLN